jgi:hypothetical protein
MVTKNTFYINVKPYYYDISLGEMAKRFKRSAIGKRMIEDENYFDTIMGAQFSQFQDNYKKKSPHDYSIDKAVGKQILAQLHEFFDKFKGSKKEQAKVHKKTLKGRTRNTHTPKTRRQRRQTL